MIKNIIFDFDGVILDSVPVKTEAFRKLFEEYSEDQVQKLIEYHLENGGKSRYVKINYFFTTVVKKEISDKEVQNYAEKYSELTKIELSNKKYLIADTINFIKNNYKKYNLHIASGADESDLKFICERLELSKYFLSIHGSPKVKNEIVRDILKGNQYKKNETILIGDSKNDYEAANINNIEFYGYNNLRLKNLNHKYITSFSDFL